MLFLPRRARSVSHERAITQSSKKTMLAEGIPYRVVGGVGFYARAEIKDMLAYLRYVVNPSDSVAFRRIVNVPRRRHRTADAGIARSKPRTPPEVSVGQAIFDRDLLLRRVVPKKQRELEHFAELIEEPAPARRQTSRSPICS